MLRIAFRACHQKGGLLRFFCFRVVIIFTAQDKDLAVEEFEPGEVVDQVVHFVAAIDVVAGEIFIVELLFIEYGAVYFLLGFVFSDNFQENRAIAVQDFIGIAHGLGGGLSQAYVVFIFTTQGTKDFVGPSHDGLFTQTAEAFCGAHNELF